MRILIIEDEPGILNLLRQGLEEEPYSADMATTGQNGLEVSIEHDICLFISKLPETLRIETGNQSATV